MKKIRDWLYSRIRVFNRKELKMQMKRWGKFLLNPRLLLCLFIAWMITNGWSYVLFLIGMLLKINWMRVVAGAYMSLLWLPFTPEKIITVLLVYCACYIRTIRVLWPCCV